MRELDIDGWTYEPAQPSAYQWEPILIHNECPIDVDNSVMGLSEGTIVGRMYRPFWGGSDIYELIQFVCPSCGAQFRLIHWADWSMRYDACG